MGDWHDLAHGTTEDISEKGIDLLPDHVAWAVNAVAKRISVVDSGGRIYWLQNDNLLIATGAEPILPNIIGLDHDGDYPLLTMEHRLAVHHHPLDRKPQSKGTLCVTRAMETNVSECTLLGTA